MEQFFSALLFIIHCTSNFPDSVRLLILFI
jgi:hypothetical protein